MILKATAAFWSDSNDFVSINMRRRRKQERGSLRLIPSLLQSQSLNQSCFLQKKHSSSYSDCSFVPSIKPRKRSRFYVEEQHLPCRKITCHGYSINTTDMFSDFTLLKTEICVKITDHLRLNLLFPTRDCTVETDG